jgi:hypothetical protein
VSRTVSRGREAGPRAEALAAGEARPAEQATGSPGRRPAGRVAAGLVVVLAAGAVAAWRAGVFSAAPTPGSGVRAAATTATVVRRDLSAATPVSATLGYAGSWTVIGQGGGTMTWLPPAGRVIGQGQVLYRTGNGSPVVLLRGRVPDWRAMSAGITGQDVSQLNHDLVALGDASRSEVAAAGWDYFSWATADGVQRLEGHLGVAYPPGWLSLGQVVFEPGALRVSRVAGRLGGPAAGPVLTGTSDRHVVTIALAAADQSEVRAGDKVSITLPDGMATRGVVSSVGTVATTSGSAGTTIPVQVRLADPGAAGGLDQAPVTVSITTATVQNVLAVPVTALLAQSSGQYVVEVVGPRGTRRWVPVRPGIFDDASGLVQVTGALAAGQRVVVAAT